MTEHEPLVIAVDLGGTQIRAALADLKGRFLHRIECPTEAEQGREAVLERLIHLIQKIGQKAPSGRLLGVGIGSPGPLNARTGLIVSAPNLPGWHNVPLVAILEQHLNLPVRMANDGNMAVLGEWVFGAGRGYQNLIYVTISTGVGGGIIASGKLVLGHRGLAGEVGHITLQADGPRCNCGNHGCWEALASGTAIAREGAAVVRAGRSPLLTEMCQGQAKSVTAKMVGQAAGQGDAAVLDIIEYAAYYSGIGVANLMNLFSPEIVLIGGGVSNLGDLLLSPLRRTAHERAMPAHRNVPIVRASLGRDVGLQGAVALFLLEDMP